MMTVVPSLDVNRVELAEALKLLSKFTKPKSKSEAIFGFEDGKLVVELGGVSAAASASGTWTGQARVAGPFLRHVSRVLPLALLVSVRIEHGILHIGTSFAPCIWENSAANPIQLPMNVSFPELLALRFKYSEQEIAQSGLEKTLGEAEGRRDAMIARAAAVLEPLGIRPADLRHLVDEKLKVDSELSTRVRCRGEEVST